MATRRHRAGKVLEIARDRHVEQALTRDAREAESRSSLGAASDPVNDGLHFRVWNSPERYSSWVSYYERDKAQSTGIA